MMNEKQKWLTLDILEMTLKILVPGRIIWKNATQSKSKTPITRSALYVQLNYCCFSKDTTQYKNTHTHAHTHTHTQTVFQPFRHFFVKNGDGVEVFTAK